jgi:predicted DCC family thiol-disulfide oxidoreductase YuxK
VVLFDGVCNLCNSTVHFIIARDPASYFRFAPLQSPSAAALMGDNAPVQTAPDSVVLVEDGKTYQASTAALRIARKLPWPWKLLYGFIVVPRFLRDPFYYLIARNRYRWFGKQEACWLPTPELRSRFLEN